MFKRIFALAAVCFLLAPAFLANADVIVEPSNDFYSQHQDRLVYLGRSFYADGPEGNVPVKTAPGAKNDTAELRNGEVVYIEYSCLYDGDYWGFIYTYPGGWVKMDQLLVLYDYISFEEEHLDEFYTYEGNYSELKKAGAVVLWPWPGAEAPIWTIEDLDTENFWVSYAYTDEYGREWGFVPLYDNRWVCLSDPLQRDIPAFNPAREPTRWLSETFHAGIEKSGGSTLVLIIVSVAVLVIATAVLIRIFWKPEKVKR